MLNTARNKNGNLEKKLYLLNTQSKAHRVAGLNCFIICSWCCTTKKGLNRSYSMILNLVLQVFFMYWKSILNIALKTVCKSPLSRSLLSLSVRPNLLRWLISIRCMLQKWKNGTLWHIKRICYCTQDNFSLSLLGKSPLFLFTFINDIILINKSLYTQSVVINIDEYQH